MFRPKSISQTGAGSSDWFMLDRHCNGIALIGDVTGTVTDWDVEFTQSDLQRGETAVVNNHSTLAAVNGSDSGNFQFIPRACRVTINTGTGTVKLGISPNGVAG